VVVVVVAGVAVMVGLVLPLTYESPQLLLLLVQVVVVMVVVVQDLLLWARKEQQTTNTRQCRYKASLIPLLLLLRLFHHRAIFQSQNVQE